MAKIRRLVLDALKPHEPTILDLAKRLADLEGVTAVNANIFEIDLRVENVKITLEGENISYEAVERVVRDLAGTIHSIDEVVAGSEIIEAVETLQD